MFSTRCERIYPTKTSIVFNKIEKGYFTNRLIVPLFSQVGSILVVFTAVFVYKVYSYFRVIIVVTVSLLYMLFTREYFFSIAFVGSGRYHSILNILNRLPT